MACGIFCIVQHRVRVEASLSLAQGVIGWRQSETTGKARCEKVIVRQFAQANHEILAGNYPALDSTNSENNSEIKREVEDRTLDRMAMIHDLWRCGGEANTYLLHRSNLALKPSR